MGWIVRDAVNRERAALGIYEADNWRGCAESMGLRVIEIDLGPVAPAMLLDGRIILDKRLNEETKRMFAWHEIGHHILHAGNCEWWRSRPGGERMVGKMERQAWEFALLFPIWE